jgi:diguanylate cyclase (GGDEF)-like protein/hemerythrin-like metal-binding protein
METFRWDPRFETGLKIVDQQHQGLVALINRFSASLRGVARVGPDTIEEVYGELAGYAHTHFQTEEDLMRAAGVDARHLMPHLEEHNSFLANVSQIREEAGTQLAAGAQPLLNFLTRWLAYHILHTDQAMSRQIAAIRSGIASSTAYSSDIAGDDAASSPLLEAMAGLFELVSERNRQLFEANQSLETKVRERTQALSEANQTLLQTITNLRSEREQTLRLSQELTEANLRLETLAMTDSLTGLHNRRYAMERLMTELSAAKRHETPLSLVLLDADGLKVVNDTYGHDAGDALIRVLGITLKQWFRADDVVCRMGGDEFLVICPHTDGARGHQVAERVRAAVSSMRVPTGEGEWKGSISIGLAALSPSLHDVKALIKAADAAVYEAKRQGRNRVVVHQPS